MPGRLEGQVDVIDVKDFPFSVMLETRGGGVCS